MEEKRILVTGGAGFLASWLVDELLTRDNYVVSVDNLIGGFIRNVNEQCKFIQMDLRDANGVARIIEEEEIEIIYHLAAYAAEGQSIFSPIQINDINITPMNNLLVAAVNNDVRQFIFTSSMAVYGNLYVGTENLTTGTEIWQYNGTTWTQVNTNRFGDANNWGSNSMAIYNGNLYVGTGNPTTGTGFHCR